MAMFDACGVQYHVPAAEARKEADHYIKLKLDKDGCEVKHINDVIGKGVFAKKDYKKGEFILEYDGELISRREGENREKNYSSALGSYIFFFKSPQGGKKLCF
uniref:Histone-lysine N-methyltransferase pr-set7 n=1 Tax=Magallana gigas TaxID=29159 RepID=K1PFJ0_MAGGI